MRLIDADQFLVDESEAYMSAQKQIHKEELLLLNSLVHKKIQLLINDAPTIEPKKGKWTMDLNGATCSECGHKYYVELIPSFIPLKPWWSYCPNCGADMRGEENG